MTPPLELRPDLDAIEALNPEREALWTRIDKATFLTPNEKRAAVGYGPVEPSLKGSEHKFNPNHDELGRFTFGTENGADGSERPQPASRRRSGPRQGTPAQEARRAIAQTRAREATRRVRELEPTWEGPQSLSDPDSIEGLIAHQEATADAAEARLAEILRDAIPNTNPSWGINRLRKELNDQGYVFKESTDSPGFLYENPNTGEQVRIMERPSRAFRTDPTQKHFNDYYYRYKPPGRPWGAHTTIPNK
jgi:hypothetical protein